MTPLKRAQRNADKQRRILRGLEASAATEREKRASGAPIANGDDWWREFGEQVTRVRQAERAVTLEREREGKRGR